jgi:hypothetical protein
MSNGNNSNQGASTTSGVTTPVTPTSPFLPKPLYKYAESGIRVARPDIIVPNEELSVEVMTDLIFEEIGGQELLETSRADLINSSAKNVYSPITNQKQVNSQFTPTNILSSQGVMAKASLDLEQYIPKLTNFIETNESGFTVSSEGKLEIKTINLENGDIVEVQVWGYSANDATIY